VLDTQQEGGPHILGSQVGTAGGFLLESIGGGNNITLALGPREGVYIGNPL